MSKSIKKTVRLADGEAFVVAPISFWHDVIWLYKTTGNECQDKKVREEWYAIANHIENWIELTVNNESEIKFDG